MFKNNLRIFLSKFIELSRSIFSSHCRAHTHTDLKMTFSLPLSFLGFVGIFACSTAAYKNVNGGTLQKCSGTGMALTGFTRNGQCIDRVDDQGSHHICINMADSHTTDRNFCSVTGQPDWCSSSMACDGGDGGECPVKQWCVCQWAFARYIERAGGCDAIQEIVCEATNLEALNAYRVQSESSDNIKKALECIEKRCKQPAARDL